jgi:hypothetical protein
MSAFIQEMCKMLDMRTNCTSFNPQMQRNVEKFDLQLSHTMSHDVSNHGNKLDGCKLCSDGRLIRSPGMVHLSYHTRKEYRASLTGWPSGYSRLTDRSSGYNRLTDHQSKQAD